MTEEITFDELLTEIDKLTKTRMRPNLTPIQMAAVRMARERGVEWKILMKWFNEKFGTDYEGKQLQHKYQYQS